MPIAMPLLGFILVLLSTVHTYYLSPNPWATIAPTTVPLANMTQAAMLLPRQRGGGEVRTIYANGQFLDDKYASYFACAPKPTSSAALPAPSSTAPPPPPPPPLPPAIPSPPPNPDLDCYLLGTVKPEGAIFDIATGRDYVTTTCAKSTPYGITKTDKQLPKSSLGKAVTLSVEAQLNAAPLGRPPIFDKSGCIDHFNTILDGCKSSNEAAFCRVANCRIAS